MSTSKNTYRVLLIDDEEATYEFVETLLLSSREDHYTVDWVAEYDEATQAILDGKHDTCLLDYHLGDYTGLDVLRGLQGYDVRVPIIMLTGQGNIDVDIESLYHGAAEYLDKRKLKAEVLTRTIRYAVKHQQDKNELADLYRQVSELEQLKTDMIRIAAHDLKQPLMTALNYANFLRDDNKHPLLDYQIEYCDEITSSVRRMQSMIADILSLERIESTETDRYEEQVDLAEQVHLAADAAMPKRNSHIVKMEVPTGGIHVLGNASHLREAAMNLMTNAVKYTPEGGEVSVMLVEEGDMAVFIVEDTGYGIPEEMQERLFSPFYRAKSKETRRIEGTGLGLHLVRNVVKRHGGEIIFRSVYGQGSMFGFRIPLRAGDV